MTIGTSLAARVLATIRRHGLLQGGETVLVAVSGGSDSVVLLDVLCELRPTLALTLEAVHVHHGLRPEADAEADAVRSLCSRLGVPAHVEPVQVRRRPPWEGLEAECRRARHAALRARAHAVGAARIATGHTADDQAETVLMRLLQGAGPRGLAGMAPASGALIRPLIETRREEVLAHLVERRLTWVEDPSNRDSRFLRNQIRHDVLPFLAGLWGVSVVEALCRSAAATRRWVVALEGRARIELERLAARETAGLILPARELERLPGELALQVILVAAAELGETRPLRGPAQRAIRDLFTAQPRHRAVRVGGLAVERSGRWLRVGPAALPALGARRWEVPGALALPEIGLRLDARYVAAGPQYVAPRDRDRMVFDADLVPSTLVVRPRRVGDRFTPFGASGERRLKAFLIDAGVPHWQRGRLPLLEAGGEIIAVVGVRRGRAAAVESNTRRILEVTSQPVSPT